MVNKLLKVKPRLAYHKYEFGRLPLIISPQAEAWPLLAYCLKLFMALTLIVHARVPQKRFAPWRLEFFVDFVWKRAEVYPRGGVRTDTTTKITNGYAAEKGISKVVSDGEWKP